MTERNKNKKVIIKNHHHWSLSYREAIDLQERLSKKIILGDDFKKITRIAGVDVKYKRKLNQVIGAVLIFTFPGLRLIEVKSHIMKSNYPYIPGLLTFREGPVAEKCFEKIENIPDLIFFDGQGYSHPRRFGLASHMGILLDLPTIGCAKKKLCGSYNYLPESKGSFSFVIEDGRIIGAALRTREKTKPVFVSSGHKISLKSVIKFTLMLSSYRIPEPIRIAHNFLNKNF